MGSKTVKLLDVYSGVMFQRLSGGVARKRIVTDKIIRKRKEVGISII